MATIKFTDFTADSSPVVADILPTVKSPFGAGSNRKVTLANLKTFMSASPTITGHATIEGVTITGATGTGNLVCSIAPTITTSLTVPAIKPNSDGTTAIEFYKADGTTAVLDYDTTNQQLKFRQIGEDAVSYATQRSSGLLNFESSQWTGSVEAKGNFSIQSITSASANNTSLVLKYGATQIFDINSGGRTTYTTGNWIRMSQASTSTTSPVVGGGTGGGQIALWETNTTVGNYNQISAINANGMTTGYLAFKNTSHSATVGSANLEFWLANGGAATNKMTLNAEGSLGLGVSPTANMTGLAVEAGTITIKETTTPTADTDYGKIYTKNDNKLYFQDGSGVEHEIAFV